MAVVEKKDKIEEKEDRPKYRVTPRYGLWTESDKIVLQVALPGVKKENIKMKALDDYFTLSARRDEIEYKLDLDFGITIEPDKTSAHYEEGLLRVEFKKFNPLEHAYNVPIE